MKNNRTILRVLVLSLALVVFLVLASCNKQGEAAATSASTAAGATTANPSVDPLAPPSTTEPTTTAPTTTATTTTEPATAEPATTAPTTTELATSEPATSETASTEAPFAELARLDDHDFCKELPVEFQNRIIIQAGSMEAGCTNIHTQTANSQYHLSTVPASTETSAMGVVKLLPNKTENAMANELGIYHYYFNPSAAGCKKQNGDQNLSYDQLYMRWTFEVTEAGTYKVASYHRVRKDTGTRNGYIQFDNGEKILLQSTITEEGFNAVNDGLAGAYLIWDGFEIELSAGKHTITHTVDETYHSYIHWRAIYLCKVA